MSPSETSALGTMASLFSLGALLDSIDSATKESLEGPKVSATAIRSRRKGDPRSESSSDIAAIDAAAIHVWVLHIPCFK